MQDDEGSLKWYADFANQIESEIGWDNPLFINKDKIQDSLEN